LRSGWLKIGKFKRMATGGWNVTGSMDGKRGYNIFSKKTDEDRAKYI